MISNDKRTLILEALEKVLKNRRYDEVTIDSVAEAAKVGKGTIYRYFKDKEDLFFQMVQFSLEKETDAVQVIAMSAAPPLDKLRQIATCISEHILKNSTAIRMMHSPSFVRGRGGAREIMQAHHERLNRTLSQVFRSGSDSGALRGNLDVDMALCLYKGMVMERTLRMMHNGMDIPLDPLVDLLISGLGPVL